MVRVDDDVVAEADVGAGLVATAATATAGQAKRNGLRREHVAYNGQRCNKML